MATQLQGLIGEIRAGDNPTFLYNLIAPDFSQIPKRPNNPFTGEGNYPSATSLFQQRRVFVSTSNKPSTIFFSAVAGYEDFSLSLDSIGSFELELDSKFFDPIDHIVSAQFGVLLFSERGVYLIVSRSGGGISLTEAVSKNELASGSKRDLAPLRVLNNVIFLSNLDNSPRVLTPIQTTPNQFGTEDLALYSQHFFRVHDSFIEEANIASSFDPAHRSGAEIISWTYSGRPDRSIWAVRADGMALNCSYAPEHGVSAWTKHVTKGRFRAVQTVYERNSDTVYVAVERGGHTFIESFAKEEASRLANSVPVDAAVRTINREPTAATELNIYDYDNGVRQGSEHSDETVDESALFGGNYDGLGAVLEGSGLSFYDADEGSHLRTSGGLYRIDRVNGADPSTTARISKIYEVEKGDPGYAAYFVHDTVYRQPQYQFEIVDQYKVQGCFHLKDQAVVVVEGEESGDDYRTVVRYDGAVEDDGSYTSAHSASRGLVIGLPFTSQFKSLPFIAQEVVIENKPKTLFSVGLRCVNSSSMKAGVDELLPTIFETSNPDPKVEFSSGVFNVEVGSEWDVDDALTIESDLPFSILGVITNFDYGDELDPRSRPPRLTEYKV